MQRRVDYIEIKDVFSGHSGISNVVNNVPYFSVNRVDYGDGLSQNFQRPMVQHEKKSIGLIKMSRTNFLSLFN